jgi:hypothetical protein
VTDAKVKAIPLRRTLAEPIEAAQAFARRLAMTEWTPRTWRTSSVPIWYGLPALEEGLERIRAALDVEHGRSGAIAPLDRARDACYQAGHELRILEEHFQAVWTGRGHADMGQEQRRALPPLTEACDRLLDTLDRLIATVGSIPQHPDRPS